MTVAAAKEKLHEYIEHADGKKVKAMYAFIESEIGEKENIFDDDMMNVLNERRANYLSGKSKTLTLEASIEKMNNYRKKK